MRALVSTWGSRGNIEPLAALALRLRELGAEARVCAPPDEEFAALFARAGVPVIPLGPSTRSVATKLKASPSADAAFRLAAELVAASAETRERAIAVAPTIRTDGATVAARLLTDPQHEAELRSR